MIPHVNKPLVDRIERKRGISRASSRTYASVLRRIHRDYSNDDWSNNLKWLQKNHIFEKIKKIPSINVRRNLVNASIVGLSLSDANHSKYDHLLEELKIKATQENRKQEMSVRQKKNFVSWKDIIKLRAQLAKQVRLKRLYAKPSLTLKEFMLLQRNLVLHLYTSIDPIRLDFAGMRVVPEKQFKNIKNKNENFLVLARGGYKFYFWKFKTSRSRELPVVVKASRTLVSVLKKHVAVLRRRFGENLLLLYNAKGGEMNRNSLSKFLTSIFVSYFDKKISASMLRTIFLSHKYAGTNILEREATAERMMHSRTTAEQSYIKKIPK